MAYQQRTYQQGDVRIIRVERIPKGKKLEHLVLARGEATGHCHEIQGNASLYETDEGLFLEVGATATLTHPEHHTLTIQTGNYKVQRILEYDHFAEEVREVKD